MSGSEYASNQKAKMPAPGCKPCQKNFSYTYMSLSSSSQLLSYKQTPFSHFSNSLSLFMAPNQDSLRPKPLSRHPITASRGQCLRKIQIQQRKRKPPTLRLGGKKPRLLVRLLRRIRLRWLKLRYLCMLKKLKEYYKRVVKELIEAGGSLESFQQRILLETSFAVPVMGVSFSTYPSSTARL